MSPHFLDEPAMAAMGAAVEHDDHAEVVRLYDAFRDAREASIIAEIRKVCGIPAGTTKVAP